MNSSSNKVGAEVFFQAPLDIFLELVSPLSSRSKDSAFYKDDLDFVCDNIRIGLIKLDQSHHCIFFVVKPKNWQTHHFAGPLNTSFYLVMISAINMIVYGAFPRRFNIFQVTNAGLVIICCISGSLSSCQTHTFLDSRPGKIIANSNFILSRGLLCNNCFILSTFLTPGSKLSGLQD